MNVQNSAGIAGEFIVRVRNADGSVKQELPKTSNLILNNLLKGMVGMPISCNTAKQTQNYAYNIAPYICVGSGNANPTEDDIALAHFQKWSESINYMGLKETEHPTAQLHPGFLKRTYTGNYQVSGLDRVNITELGLGNDTGIPSRQTGEYYLWTRALLRDHSGAPTSVTVLQGEVLEVEYFLHIYIDVRVKYGEFQLTIDNNPPETFEYAITQVEESNLGRGQSLCTKQIPFVDASNIIAYQSKEPLNTPVPNWSLTTGPMADFSYKNFPREIYTGNESLNTGYTEQFPVTDSRYGKNELINNGLDTGTGTATATYRSVRGTNWANFPNGIRAFFFGSARKNDGGNLFTAARVVVKNKVTGLGIPKTDKQSWEFIGTISISRYTGTP